MRVPLFAAAVAFVSAASSALADPVTLDWDDLMPEGEIEKLEKMYADYMADLERQMRANAGPLSEAGAGGIAEGSPMDEMKQIGTFATVPELDGKDVRLPGYIVPFDFDSGSEYSEFLLVPYFGACIHTPPPPPNQIVYVTAEKPVKIDDVWAPVWVEGRMTAEPNMNDTGDAAYTLTLDALTPYSE